MSSIPKWKKQRYIEINGHILVIEPINLRVVCGNCGETNGQRGREIACTAKAKRYAKIRGIANSQDLQ